VVGRRRRRRRRCATTPPNKFGSFYLYDIIIIYFLVAVTPNYRCKNCTVQNLYVQYSNFWY